MKRHKTKIKFLQKDEVEKLIAGARDNPRDYALMQVLFSTGLRVSEAVALQRADFSRSDIDTTKELSIIGKGGWQRPVFFSPESLQAIKGWLEVREDKDKRLFPVTSRTVERMVKARAVALGLSATPHTFRHSLATHLLKQGANIRIVQEMLGHRSLSSTMIYTGITNRDLLEAHKKLL